MGNSIPEDYLDLFDRRSFAHLATIMPDGSPQVTPVWIDYDGEYVLVNTAKGRLKDRNMSARPQVALSILDPENPYRYITIRGHVVAIDEEEAGEHIDKMAFKYQNLAEYPYRARGEVRRLYKIKPDQVYASG